MSKLRTPDEVVAELRDGMTIGIGGWGSRRKPMALVHAIARSKLKDLHLVSFGGPGVGLLCALKKVRKLTFGFVSLDSIPLEPHFRKARQAGELKVLELDEGMLQWGLRAAGLRLPFLPTRAGLGTDVMKQAEIKTVEDPYGGPPLVAMPALNLDAALVHVNRADARGNGQVLGPDPFFDDLYCMAATKAYVSCEKVVETAELLEAGPAQSIIINRMMVQGVIEAPGGAGFTQCLPDYARDEAAMKAYAATAKDPAAWEQYIGEVLR